MPRRNAVLIDTGPLVALFSRKDELHAACLATFKTLKDPLLTIWPVLTEALYLLDFSVDAQDGLWGFLLAQTLLVLPLEVEDVPRMQELMHRYRDRHMDFADAALVRVAEREHITTMFTTDRRDFQIYQPRHARHFHLLPFGE